MAESTRKADGRVTSGFKLWLSLPDGEGVMGDGKWRLLKAIGETGSLVAAAELLGISYRKAWGDLRKAEKRLDVTLIEKHRGGKVGGETHLTEVGRRWVKAYDEFHTDVEKAVKLAHAEHFGSLT